MTNSRQLLGSTGEDLAVRYLEKQGYRIIERNYRTPLGEIDIIARDGRTIVFVEVKTRRTRQYGSPRLALTPRKQKKISMTALLYLKQAGQNTASARFDVITIERNAETNQVDLIRNAFELAYS